MKVYNYREIVRCLRDNGYSEKRQRGSHVTWEHYETHRTITVNVGHVNRMVWQRLVKEFNLICKF